jgi:hypothetical protein
LPPLTPEAEALLAQRLATVQAALAAGAGVEELVHLLGPAPADPAWHDHLLAALAKLAHPATPPLLAALFGQDPERGRRKALKRALHLLRTQGVPVADDVLPREARPAAPGAAPVVARVSPVLGNGERYAVLEGSRQALGATMVVVRLSDTAGLLELHALEANRAQREELWQHFREQGLADWAEAPVAYVGSLLEAAYALNPAAPAAADYGGLRSRLWQLWGNPEAASDPEAEVPPLREPEVAAALERARELAQHPLFHTWLPGPEEVTPWVEKIKEAEASPLILAEHQQRARLEGILLEAARTLYPPESRVLWHRRLVHQAYFFRLRHLPGEARVVRAAAQDLASRAASPLMGDNPLLLALVQFAVGLALEYQRQMQPGKAGGVVAPPAASPLIVTR